MNTIYLVRHGENLANITKEFSYKKVDYPLTERGILQAQQTADYFKDRQVDEIYSSPLKRAQQTAEIIAQTKGLPVIVMENFREVNIGEMEDWPPTVENWRIYMDTVADWYNGKPETAFPGGENLFMLQSRMRKGIRKVVERKSGRSIVIVGHGGIFAGTITDLCPDADPQALRGEYRNCAISELEIEYRDGRLAGELKGWGFCSHLNGDAADFVSAIPETLSFAKKDEA